MPFRSSKSINDEVVQHAGFDGGLNLSVSGEALQPNELAEALNVEHDPVHGGLKVRGGLRRVANFADVGGAPIFFAANGGENQIFGMDYGNRKLFGYRPGALIHPYNTTPFLGTGDYLDPLSVVQWDRSIYDDTQNTVAMVGVSSIIYQGEFSSKMVMLSNAPSGRCLFTWGGRLGTSEQYGQLHLSAVGDPDAWANSPADLSSAQFIDIGYKDGNTLRAIVPLGQDLIVFKGHRFYHGVGDIWRISGYIPDTVVYKVVSGVTTFSQNSVHVAGNDVFFLNLNGLGTLSSVMEYGDIKLSWLDSKVSDVLSKELDRYSKLWHIPSKGQLWIQGRNKKNVWVFHYRNKSWTRFVFPDDIDYACELRESVGAAPKVHIVSRGVIYVLDDSLSRDENDARPIRAHLRFGTTMRSRQILVKGMGALYRCKPETNAEVNINGFRVALPPSASGRYASDDARPAFGNVEPVVGNWGNGSVRRKCLVRGWGVTPEITISGSGCSIQRLSLELAEV